MLNPVSSFVDGSEEVAGNQHVRNPSGIAIKQVGEH
jgi:hypothetical protein